jgi:hypothetical protein
MGVVEIADTRCDAGQEIYYSTHQFFLSERSLYVVVFNLLAPEQSHVEYWYAANLSRSSAEVLCLMGMLTLVLHAGCAPSALREETRRSS